MFQKLETLLNAEWRHIISETWDIFPRNLRYIFLRRRIDICATFTFSFVQLWSRRGQKSKMHLLSYFYWKSLKRSENLSRNIKSDILLKSMLSNPNKSNQVKFKTFECTCPKFIVDTIQNMNQVLAIDKTMFKQESCA